jgi:hypothetical protein
VLELSGERNDSREKRLTDTACCRSLEQKHRLPNRQGSRGERVKRPISQMLLDTPTIWVVESRLKIEANRILLPQDRG